MSFSLIEWLTLTGLVQSVFVLVYIILRARDWTRAALTLSYFLVLGLTFILQFSLRLDAYGEQIKFAQWLCWLLTPPLCYLLVLQVAKDRVPRAREFLVLLLIPIVLSIGFVLRNFTDVCEIKKGVCLGLFHWFYWLSSIAGIISMLALWFHKNIFSELWNAKTGKEKYWLIMVLILANIAIITINMFRSGGGISEANAETILTIMAMVFVYVVTTTMFRVYPSPLTLNSKPRLIIREISYEEKKIAEKIKTLMDLDKLYHDPKFDRCALARELEVSESVASRVVNVAFEKSFPKLLSEYRVEDAKRMLQNYEIPVQIVATEVGFNSIASFNRIFKDLTGVSPTQYRQSIKEDNSKSK